MAGIRPAFVSLVLAAAIGGIAPLCGQGGGETARAMSDADTEIRRAEVVIDGQRLFSVRGVSVHPADVRARQIEGRIRALAANRDVDARSLTLEDRPGATWIMAGGQRTMAVLDEDAAIEEVAREPLAELYKARIGDAIEAYRRDRRAGVLWLHALYALAATVLVMAAARLGRRIVPRLRGRFERRYRARMEGIEGRALHLVNAEQIRRTLAGLLDLIWGVTIAVIVYFYLTHVLALFPWTRGFANSLFATAMNPLRTLSLGLIGIIPDLVFLAILTVVTRYALKLIRVLFDGLASGALKLGEFDPEWAWPTYRLVRILVIAFALVVAYPYIPGSNSGAFKGVSLFVGIIFSLGSSSIIGNFIAGYSMTYRRTFRIGDRVRIGEQAGDVERMRLMVTHLRTIKNEEVVVPNSVILGTQVVNYSSISRERGLILHTTVGIGYETPWRQVEAMLLEAAARTGGLSHEAAPFVVLKELGDFCVIYEINAFCDNPREMEAIYGALHRHILDVFNEYDVQIMTPAYESDPEKPKVVPRDQWYAAPARPPALKSTDQPAAVSQTTAVGGDGEQELAPTPSGWRSEIR